MDAPADVSFRAARADDALAIAELHADSWRRHYRGAYSDAFLDGDVAGYLTRVWTDRMAAPQPSGRTILAEHDGQVVGLAHTILDADPAWGALLDRRRNNGRFRRAGDFGCSTRNILVEFQEYCRFTEISGRYPPKTIRNTRILRPADANTPRNRQRCRPATSKRHECGLRPTFPPLGRPSPEGMH